MTIFGVLYLNWPVKADGCRVGGISHLFFRCTAPIYTFRSSSTCVLVNEASGHVA